VTSPCVAAVESPLILTTLLSQSVLPAEMVVVLTRIIQNRSNKEAPGDV
jgi:hypothetical protein